MSEKDQRLRLQGMPRPGINIGDPQPDDMMFKAKRLREQFGYSFNQSINEAERTTREQRADSGNPVSASDIQTWKQMNKYVKGGLRDTTLDQATKQSAINSFVAQQSASAVKRQIEKHTGKPKTRTMGKLSKKALAVASLLRGGPALVAGYIMKPKPVGSAQLDDTDYSKYKMTLK